MSSEHFSSTKCPNDISITALITELVTRLIPSLPSYPPPRYVPPTSTHPKYGHRSRPFFFKSYEILLNKSIMSELKCNGDISPQLLESLFARFLLQLRTSSRLFDRADQIEKIAFALLNRLVIASPPLMMAYPCTQHQILGMRRTGWTTQQYNGKELSANPMFSGLPVYPLSDCTFKSVLLLLVLLSDSNYKHVSQDRNLIPDRIRTDIGNTHMTMDRASSLIDSIDIEHNPSLRNAALHNPWLNVYSESSMHLNADFVPPAAVSTADKIWHDQAFKPHPSHGLSFSFSGHSLKSTMSQSLLGYDFHDLSRQPSNDKLGPNISTITSNSLISPLNGAQPYDIMDWLPSLPPFSKPNDSQQNAIFTSSSTESLAKHGLSVLHAVGGSFHSMPETASVDSTWNPANASRSFSIIPQPESKKDSFIGSDTLNQAQTDSWVDAVTNGNNKPPIHLPLLSWDSPDPLRQESGGQEHDSSFINRNMPTPFLTDVSPLVQAEIMERLFLGVPNPGESLSEDILVRHVYLLICGIESRTFRWLGDPTLTEIALDTVNPHPLLQFGYRNDRTSPPRVSGISPRVMNTFMERFIGIGSGLRRLELVAQDLRNRKGSVGFTGCGFAQALDDLVGHVRALVLERRHQVGGMTLRTFYTGVATLEFRVNEICALVGSSALKLHYIQDMSGSLIIALLAKFVQAVSITCPDVHPTFLRVSDWSLFAFSKTVQPMLRWLHQWLTICDPYEQGVFWDYTDPHREFPVVWTTPGPTTNFPTLDFWSSGFQVRADHVHDVVRKFSLLPSCLLKRSTDVYRVFNTLSGCFGMSNPLISPLSFFQWTRFLIWPMSFTDLKYLLERQFEQRVSTTNHIIQYAAAMDAAKSSKSDARTALHLRSQASQAQHRLLWLEERKTAHIAIANRKRKLMTELREFAEIQASLKAEDRRLVELEDQRRIRSQLYDAERWSQLIEREKQQLLDDYEAKILKSKQEMDRVIHRRRRLERDLERGQEDGSNSNDESIANPSVFIGDITPMSDPSLSLQSDVLDRSNNESGTPLSIADITSHITDTYATPNEQMSGLDSNSDLTSSDSSANINLKLLSEKEQSEAGALPFVPLSFKPTGLIKFTTDNVPNFSSIISTSHTSHSDQSSASSVSTMSSSNTSFASDKQPTSQGDSLKSISTDSLQKISFNMALVSFRRYLDNNLALCEYSLLASVLTLPRLIPELEKLPLIFCFQNSMFRHDLLGALMPRVLGNRPKEDVESALVRVFHNVEGFSVKTIPPCNTMNDDDPHLFDFLTFEYKPEPPFWMLVSPENIHTYNIIMRFIVRLKYLDYTCRALYQSVRSIWQLPVPTGQYPHSIASSLESITKSITAIDALLVRFHAEVLHTAAAFWSYTCDVAVGDSWQSFMALIKRLEAHVMVTAKHNKGSPNFDNDDGIKSVHGLYQAHCKMVSTIFFRCMLRPKQAPIQDAIDAQIRAVLVAEQIARDYIHARDNYIKLQFPSATFGKDGKRGVRFRGQVAPGMDGLQSQLLKIHSQITEQTGRFRNNIRYIIEILRCTEEETAGLRCTNDVMLGDKISGLSGLLFRLDFNRFYANDAPFS